MATGPSVAIQLTIQSISKQGVKEDKEERITKEHKSDTKEQ